MVQTSFAKKERAGVKLLLFQGLCIANSSSVRRINLIIIIGYNFGIFFIILRLRWCWFVLFNNLVFQNSSSQTHDDLLLSFQVLCIGSGSLQSDSSVRSISPVIIIESVFGISSLYDSKKAWSFVIIEYNFSFMILVWALLFVGSENL